jgi:hypothetical protein
LLLFVAPFHCSDRAIPRERVAFPGAISNKSSAVAGLLKSCSDTGETQ